MISACGVVCSDCPAYRGAEKGIEHQRRTVEAWMRIYERLEKPEAIACGGCLGPDEAVFYTSVQCTARRCCLSKGFTTCAECPVEACELLGRAQSVWDGVPAIGKTLSEVDFEAYARPYCGHRERLRELRVEWRRKGMSGGEKYPT